jgi:hypothetical protein
MDGGKRAMAHALVAAGAFELGRQNCDLIGGRRGVGGGDRTECTFYLTKHWSNCRKLLFLSLL